MLLESVRIFRGSKTDSAVCWWW